ncbi:preprotein translocase subunit SecE [Microlunatus parietis]|uniref:Protein translocase subunit SecE n=1 Tax=Microlunatus parietis TaxID=682979 RepID=A0A7Y9L902_9ACTN|nr:preprotein translocase subunit SecE [Microlunatus parietis]NYE71294.1 preprotein translocase subunit SecE [Microlunatus parietis]
MADDKDKGPADEPDLSAGDPERQSEEEKQEGPESERTEEPTNEDLKAAAEKSADESDPETGDDDSDDAADQEKELVSVGAASKTQSEGGRSESAASGESKGRQKKTEATPKQHKGDNRPRRTGPITLIKESIAELRKVVYPTGPQLLTYFVVVLVFVLFIIAVVSLLDLGFGWVIFQIFGN